MIVIDPNVTHVNARVRALKSLLFKHEETDYLLDQTETDMIDVLLNSPYRLYLEEALAHNHGVNAIEAALTQSMVETFQRVLRWTSGDLYELISLFMTRWDLPTIKTLLRYRHRGLDLTDTVAASHLGPALTLDHVHRLAQLDSMEELVGALASWRIELCGILLSRMAEYRDSGDLSVLENALDYQYYVMGARRLADRSDLDARLVREVLQMEIDRANLRAVFLQPQAGERAAPRFLPGGTVSAVILQRMVAAGDIAEAMTHLESTMYRDLVEGLYQYMQTRRLSPLDRLFDLFVLKQLKRMARTYVLSSAVIMSYVWHKYNEVINLRLIARGHQRQLPRGRMHEEVLHA